MCRARRMRSMERCWESGRAFIVESETRCHYSNGDSENQMIGRFVGFSPGGSTPESDWRTRIWTWTQVCELSIDYIRQVLAECSYWDNVQTKGLKT